MRPFLLFIFIVFSLSGCTTYQYLTVSGKDIRENEKQEFVMENDSLRLKYNFNGQNGPVAVEVQNKLDKPIYVDWKRSALIVNDKAISYVPGTVPITGSVETSGSGWVSNRGNFISTSSSGSFSGSVGIPEEMDFIPPGSYKSKVPLGVTNVYYDVPKERQQRQSFAFLNKYSGEYHTGSVMAARFADTSSPLLFTSYLTVYAEGDFEKPVVLQHTFYISEIMTTTMGPRNFQFMSNKEGNRFYTSRVNGFGKVAGGFGIVAGLALVSYADVKAQEFAEKRGYYQYDRRY